MIMTPHRISFEPPKCAYCKTNAAIAIDSFCSSTCRKEFYIKNKDWKEPENPKGWYVATFETYYDTKNYSPEEIKDWNQSIFDAPSNIKNLKNTQKYISKEIEERRNLLQNLWPFSYIADFDSEYIDFEDVGTLSIEKLSKFIDARKNMSLVSKQEIERIREEVEKLQQKSGLLSKEIENQERCKRRILKYSNR